MESRKNAKPAYSGWAKGKFWASKVLSSHSVFFHSRLTMSVVYPQRSTAIPGLEMRFNPPLDPWAVMCYDRFRHSNKQGAALPGIAKSFSILFSAFAIKYKYRVQPPIFDESSYSPVKACVFLLIVSPELHPSFGQDAVPHLRSTLAAVLRVALPYQSFFSSKYRRQRLPDRRSRLCPPPPYLYQYHCLRGQDLIVHEHPLRPTTHWAAPLPKAPHAAHGLKRHPKRDPTAGLH